MALENIIDTLESVPEALRSEYVAHEGKFKLQVNGLDDYKELKDAIAKERQAAKEAKAELSKYAGIKDPEKIKELMSKLENDEETRLIADGKLPELVAKKTEKYREEADRRVNEANAKAEAAENKVKAVQGRLLEDELRSAAIQAGVHKHAIDDVLLRGKMLFTLGEDGRAVQLDSDGDPVLGKDGKSKFNPAEWAESLRSTAPHLFPVSNSGSPDGGKPQKSGGKDFSNLPPVERLTAARAAQAARR